MSNELKIFNNEEFGKIEVFRDGDNPLFNLKDVCFALGYTRANGVGKVYLRKDRIEKVLENGDISTCVHDGHKFINEDALYDFIFEAKTDSARRFRKWVTSEILPTIRKTGGFVQDGREEEFIANYFPSFSEDVKLSMVQDLLKTNEELKPKAEGFDRFLNSNGNLDFQEFCKSVKLGIGRNKFMQKLRDEKILMSDKSRKNLPYQSYVDRGYFEVVQVTTSSNFSTAKTVITKRGCEWLAKKCSKWDIDMSIPI